MSLRGWERGLLVSRLGAGRVADIEAELRRLGNHAEDCDLDWDCSCGAEAAAEEAESRALMTPEVTE